MENVYDYDAALILDELAFEQGGVEYSISGNDYFDSS